MTAEAADSRENQRPPIDTFELRAAFVQAQSQIVNDGKFEPVVVISKALALQLLDRVDAERVENDDLHDDVTRLLAEVGELRRRTEAFAEVNAWRADWMRRAVAEMSAVLDDPANLTFGRARCMEALIAEDYGDGDGDEDAYGWQPTFSFPRVEVSHIVDMHLGGGL